MKRQGDLLFVRVADGVTEPTRPHPLGHVLARGEATGHAHALAQEDGARTEVLVDGRGRLIVRVRGEEAVSVVHEEHGAISLEPGVWEVRRQREYTTRPRTDPTVMD